MLKKLLIGLTILNVSTLSLLMPAIAQEVVAEEAAEEVAEEAMDEVWEFTFGTVVRISKDQVTIMEYNFEQEQEMEGAYIINEATEYLNIDGLSGLRVDDEVEIEFKIVDGKNVVMAIAKDEGESLEEIPEDLQFEDMMEEGEEEPVNG